MPPSSQDPAFSLATPPEGDLRSLDPPSTQEWPCDQWAHGAHLSGLAAFLNHIAQKLHWARQASPQTLCVFIQLLLVQVSKESHFRITNPYPCEFCEVKICYVNKNTSHVLLMILQIVTPYRKAIWDENYKSDRKSAILCISILYTLGDVPYRNNFKEVTV